MQRGARLMMVGMTKKVRWGVLSTAAIGVKKVIPGMQLGQYSEVTAIASRDLATAQGRRRRARHRKGVRLL